MNSSRQNSKRTASPIVGALFIALVVSAPAQAGTFASPLRNPQDQQGQKSQAQLDAEQQQRDQEQQRRDREQEKKDREQERLDRMQELYDESRNDLDDEHYQRAAEKFAELAQMNGPQTDAALYWKAFAENKQGKRDASLATIASLKKTYPQSRWKKDAEALEIEVRQGTGQTVNPESTNDADLKALALQGIMNNDPKRGIPIVEKYLNGPATPKEKAKALFVLAQNGSTDAQEVLGRIASGQSNPELQRKAVEYLGMYGGKKAGDQLAKIYASSTDTGVKQSVIRAYLLSGNRERLMNIAKNEKAEDLRHEAIRTLGMTGGREELKQLYDTQTSTEARKNILEALFLAGDSARIGQVALQEKDPELRRAAVRDLGMMGGKTPELQQIYAHDSDHGVKEEVLNAYFIGGNASGLVAVARSEKDPDLKKRAVEKLSLMGSKEGNDYLMELLQK
jgi:hypothetical protein